MKPYQFTIGEVDFVERMETKPAWRIFLKDGRAVGLLDEFANKTPAPGAPVAVLQEAVVTLNKEGEIIWGQNHSGVLEHFREAGRSLGTLLYHRMVNSKIGIRLVSSERLRVILEAISQREADICQAHCNVWFETWQQRQFAKDVASASMDARYGGGRVEGSDDPSPSPSAPPPEQAPQDASNTVSSREFRAHQPGPVKTIGVVPPPDGAEG
jgi:hypothetical protein